MRINGLVRPLVPLLSAFALMVMPAIATADVEPNDGITQTEGPLRGGTVYSGTLFSTNDGDSLRSGVGVLSNDVEKNLQAAGSFFKGIGERSPELEEAMAGDPKCGQFANGG